MGSSLISYIFARLLIKWLLCDLCPFDHSINRHKNGLTFAPLFVNFYPFINGERREEIFLVSIVLSVHSCGTKSSNAFKELLNQKLLHRETKAQRNSRRFTSRSRSQKENAPFRGTRTTSF